MDRKSLTDAFIACNDAFSARHRGFPYVDTGLEAELDEPTALMGDDFHPTGSSVTARR